MKKKIYGIIIGTLLILSLAGCGNQQFFDTTYTFDRAIIQLQNGEMIDTKIKAWNDYDGEQLQIVAEDGTVYLTSSFNCTLINE